MAPPKLNRPKPSPSCERVSLLLTEYLSKEIPHDWPTRPQDILSYAFRITSKLLPLLHSAHAMWTGHQTLSQRAYYMSHTFRNLIDKHDVLSGRIQDWVNTIPSFVQVGEPFFFGTYKPESNRMHNSYNFDSAHIISLFGLQKRDNFNNIRNMCFYFGSPWTTIQRREVGGKQAWVLCTPTGMATYAL